MESRSPARWMAPIALLAAVAAVALVVTGTTGDGAADNGAPPAASTTETGGRGSGEQARDGEGGRTSTDGEGPRTYRVRTGDTLGSIADEHGLTVEELLELNPEVDPQTLNVGQRIRLRR